VTLLALREHLTISDLGPLRRHLGVYYTKGEDDEGPYHETEMRDFVKEDDQLGRVHATPEPIAQPPAGRNEPPVKETAAPDSTRLEREMRKLDTFYSPTEHATETVLQVSLSSDPEPMGVASGARHDTPVERRASDLGCFHSDYLGSRILLLLF
jgi:hypothetical protein